MKIHREFTVRRPPDALYAFWRKLENLAQIAPNDTVVTQTGPRHSHWVARGPGGREFAWDAEIVRDEPAHAIAWRSLPGGDVRNSGEVRFEPLSGGATRVDMRMEYTPPGGFLGKLVGPLVQNQVESEIDAGIGRVKSELERRT